VFIAVLALTLLVNAVFWLALDRVASGELLAPHGGESNDLVLAARGGEHEVLVANRSDELLLYEDSAITRQQPFDSLIGAITAAPDGNGPIAVGTSDGKVTMLDPSLTPGGELSVNGRVVGLALTPDGGLVVGHGIGAFGDRFYVSFFPTPHGEPAYTTKVDFTIGAVAAGDDAAVYGTMDSRVGLIPATGEGEPAWETTLRSPVTRLLALPTGGVLAGGEDGTLTLLDGQGGVRWVTSLGQYPVRGLAFNEASGTYLSGDGHGTIYAVDGAGQVRLSREVTDSVDLEAILPSADGGFLVVPRQGAWQLLNPEAIAGADRAGALRLAWYATNVALLLALLATAVATVDRWRVATARHLGAARRGRLAYVFLLPAFALIALFSYYPAGMAFYYSFTSFSLRSVTEFVGLENFREILLEDRYFRVGFANMVIIVLTSILKTITVPLLVAELIFWLRNSVHQYLFRTLFVLPAVVPDLVFTLMWRQVYDPNTGLLNQLLAAVGLEQWQRAWLGNEATALWAIITVGFPFVSAFAFLILLGGLLAINPEFFDAAKVDGASRWARFWHIDVPLLLPQFRILLFFAVIGTVQGFAAIFILTRGGPGYATYVPALQMYLRIGAGDFGYASAIGVILFVIILALTLVVLRLGRRQEIETA